MDYIVDPTLSDNATDAVTGLTVFASLSSVFSRISNLLPVPGIIWVKKGGNVGSTSGVGPQLQQPGWTIRAWPGHEWTGTDVASPATPSNWGSFAYCGRFAINPQAITMVNVGGGLTGQVSGVVVDQLYLSQGSFDATYVVDRVRVVGLCTLSNNYIKVGTLRLSNSVFTGGIQGDFTTTAAGSQLSIANCNICNSSSYGLQLLVANANLTVSVTGSIITGNSTDVAATVSGTGTIAYTETYTVETSAPSDGTTGTTFRRTSAGCVSSSSSAEFTAGSTYNWQLLSGAKARNLLPSSTLGYDALWRQRTVGAVTDAGAIRYTTGNATMVQGTASVPWVGEDVVWLSSTPAMEGTGARTCQWQRSADGGVTWSNLTACVLPICIDRTAVKDTSYMYRVVWYDSASHNITNAPIGVTTYGPKSPVTLMVGDSITASIPSDSPGAFSVLEDAMVQAANGKGRRFSYVNAGVSGTTTLNWTQNFGVVGSTSPYPAMIRTVDGRGTIRAIQIMLGTNDARTADNIAAASWLSNMQTLTSRLLAQFPSAKILIDQVPYVAGVGGNGLWNSPGSNNLIQAYNANISNVVNGSTIVTGATGVYAHYAASVGEGQPNEDINWVHPSTPSLQGYLGPAKIAAWSTAFPAAIGGSFLAFGAGF